MINYYDLLKPAQKDYYSELLARRLRGSGGIEEIKGVPPLTFQSDGTPLLDYLISGNMVQTGTPTPTTPIQPSECGERTGNLWDSGDVTVALHERFKSIQVSLEQGEYTLSFEYESENTGDVTVIFYNESTIIQTFNITITNDKGNVSIVSAQPITAIRLYSANGYTTSYDYAAEYTKIMLNTGSTALPYEPYGYKIPILNNSQTTNVYLGEVQSTRKIKKYEMTGNEDITYQSAYSRFFFIRADAYYTGTVRTTPCICSHYQSIHDGRAIDDIPNESIYVATADNKTAFNVKTTDFTDATDFKSYLQQQYANGTPVTIWYILTTAQRGIVNEPLRKIGDYADTLSYEQAGVQIPTNRGNTIIDVGTELKPSEMYIKYQE